MYVQVPTRILYPIENVNKPESDYFLVKPTKLEDIKYLFRAKEPAILRLNFFVLSFVQLRFTRK